MKQGATLQVHSPSRPLPFIQGNQDTPTGLTRKSVPSPCPKDRDLTLTSFEAWEKATIPQIKAALEKRGLRL